jgi:hypothetical protein
MTNERHAKYLELYFDWSFIKTKELKLLSNDYSDRHAFYIIDEDGNVLHGWIIEPIDR